MLIFYCGACLASFLLWLAGTWNQGAIRFKLRSQCDNCQRPLHWYELFPIFSSLFARFRCVSCSKPISFNYFLSEFFIGLLWVILVHHLTYSFDNTLLAQIFLLLRIILLILMAFIDILERWVPDVLQLGIFICSLIELNSVHFSFVLILFFMLFLIFLLGSQYIGGADLKLIFSLSLTIPFHLFPHFLFISSLSGLFFVFFYNRFTKTNMIEIPFVPFLSLAYYCLLFL